MVPVLEGHLEALTRRSLMIMDSTQVKACDAIETVCQEEPEETKYEILQRCTRIICDRKSKIQEKT